MDHPNLPFGFALPGHTHPPIPPTANMLGAHPAGHPGPTSSPPQSVPGRRTPLGSVGLGGFYAQSLGMLPPGDENKPDSGASAAMEKTSPSLMMAPSSSNNTSGPMSAMGMGSGSGASGGGGSNGGGGKQKNRQGKTVRLNINARERRRMHDLNDALDELRNVIPYAHSPSNAIEELRRLLAYIQSTTGAAPLDLASFPAAAKLQALLQSAGNEFNDPPGSSS